MNFILQKNHVLLALMDFILQVLLEILVHFVEPIVLLVLLLLLVRRAILTLYSPEVIVSVALQASTQTERAHAKTAHLIVMFVPLSVPVRHATLTMGGSTHLPALVVKQVNTPTERQRARTAQLTVILVLLLLVAPNASLFIQLIQAANAQSQVPAVLQLP